MFYRFMGNDQFQEDFVNDTRMKIQLSRLDHYDDA